MPSVSGSGRAGDKSGERREAKSSQPPDPNLRDEKKEREKAKTRSREKEKEKEKEKAQARTEDKHSGKNGKDARDAKDDEIERPLTAEQVREKEAQALTVSLMRSHLGYLAQPLLKVSEALEIDHMTMLASALIIFALLHISLPAFLVPHLSALVTLLCPLQASFQVLATDLDRNKKSKGDPKRPVGDGAQWTLYWLVYFVWEAVRGWVLLWRPGWKGVTEIARTLSLVGTGGGWYARAVLRPSGPSSELKEAMQRESKEEHRKKDAAK